MPCPQLSRLAHRVWQKRGLISGMLLPLSLLAELAVRRKTARYAANPGRVWHADVPIVVVGNIYVGGTGKTPVVMSLIEALRMRGWTPGVISRGYGVKAGKHPRTGHGPVLAAAQFGDEPALLAATSGAPISVHPSRVLAAQALLADYPDVDVIVADDGLQHLALGRDIEILVQDERGTGNGRLLPAGPLREPASRLNCVDIVINNVQGVRPATERPSFTRPVHVDMRLTPTYVVHLASGERQEWTAWRAQHRRTAMAAVAGIGHPERFFTMLRQAGLALEQTLALADHAVLTESTFTGILSEIILITAKDAVKCDAIKNDKLFAVEVHAEFSDTAWLDTVDATLRRTAAARQAHTPCA